METNLTSRSASDLFGVLVLSLLYLMAVLAGQGEPLRSVLGLPFVLVLPGYSLLAAIDSSWRELDVSERLALSCVLSLAIVISVAMGLNVIRQLHLARLACALEGIIVAGCSYAYWRRTEMAVDGDDYLVRLPLGRENRSSLATMIDLITVGCVCVTLFLMADVRQSERAPIATTALYLLGRESKAGGYVRRVACGSPFQMTVGVVNNEQAVKDYSILMEIDDHPSRILTRITLNPGQIWEEQVEVDADRCGAWQSVAFYLLEGGSENSRWSVYQRVHVAPGDELDEIREKSRARGTWADG